MQPIIDNTVNIISIDKHGLLIHSTCLYPFYSPDNTKVAFWVQDYDYSTDIYLDTYHLYIKDLITDDLTKVDIGNGNNPLVHNVSANRVIYSALFSPDGSKILFYSTSTNLIPADTILAAKTPNTSARWFVYDLANESYIRAMYEVSYGNLEDYHEALWLDNDKIVLVSYANNLGGVYALPVHREIFLCNITSGIVTCLSTDPSLLDPYFITDSYNITVTIDAISFFNDSLGQCIRLITGEELIVVQDLPGINALGTVTADIFSWDSLGNKFLFRISHGTSVVNDTNNVTDDFVYDMLDDTIYPLNENTGGTVFGDSFSKNALFSPDGTKVAFLSASSNIDLTSTNNVVNVYTKELSTGILTRISKSVLGGNILLDVLGYNWLSDNKIVFTTYSKNIVVGDDNNILDWFVHDINLNTTKRINYTPNGDLLFSTNNEFSSNIRRETFNTDGNTILFATILNSFDSTDYITPAYDKYNIFMKVFEDKTLSFPALGTSTVSPNDAINNTVKNTTSADVYRVADTITGIPTFGIIGSQYVERANSLMYRNDIASSIRWMSLTYPNLPYNAPSTIKIGAGIFKATPTLIDDVLDVKQNSVTTTTNPVIGILSTYTVRPQNDIVLVSSGEDQQRICDPTVYLEATIQGNFAFGHTSEWELISGEAIVSGGVGFVPLTQISFTRAYYSDSPTVKDRVFRYWIDKGKYNEQYQDITVYATPTSTYKADMVVTADIETPYYSELIIDSYFLINNFDYNIPFNSQAGQEVSEYNIVWSLPRLFALNDITSEFYKPQYKSSFIEIHDGSDWVVASEIPNGQPRKYDNLPVYSTIRFGAIYYDLNQTTSKAYYSTPSITSPQMLANNVLSKMTASSPDAADYTINTTIYVLDTLIFEDTLSPIPTSSANYPTIETNVYVVGTLTPESTLAQFNLGGATVVDYTLTFFNGAAIGG